MTDFETNNSVADLKLTGIVSSFCQNRHHYL